MSSFLVLRVDLLEKPFSHAANISKKLLFSRSPM